MRRNFTEVRASIDALPATDDPLANALRIAEDRHRAAGDALAELRRMVDAIGAEKPDRMLTLAEAAHVVGRHIDTMRALARRMGLGRKVGGKWVFSRSELQALVKHRVFP